MSDQEVEKVPGPKLVQELRDIAIVDAKVGWGHVLALSCMFTLDKLKPSSGWQSLLLGKQRTRPTRS